MNKRLYVGNLSFDTTETTLREHFGRFGTVSEVKLMTDRNTGDSRGFAFVEMATDTEASNAITRLGGQMLDGRELRVNEAQERAPRDGTRLRDGAGRGHR